MSACRYGCSSSHFHLGSWCFSAQISPWLRSGPTSALHGRTILSSSFLFGAAMSLSVWFSGSLSYLGQSRELHGRLVPAPNQALQVTSRNLQKQKRKLRAAPELGR